MAAGTLARPRSRCRSRRGPSHRRRRRSCSRRSPADVRDYWTPGGIRQAGAARRTGPGQAGRPRLAAVEARRAAPTRRSAEVSTRPPAGPCRALLSFPRARTRLLCDGGPDVPEEDLILYRGHWRRRTRPRAVRSGPPTCNSCRRTETNMTPLCVYVGTRRARLRAGLPRGDLLRTWARSTSRPGPNGLIQDALGSRGHRLPSVRRVLHAQDLPDLSVTPGAAGVYDGDRPILCSSPVHSDRAFSAESTS